jgi:hypothetical protein
VSGIRPSRALKSEFFLYIYFVTILQKYMAVTNLAKMYIYRRGSRRQGLNAVAHGVRSRQEWALAWPRGAKRHGVRGPTPWPAAAALAGTGASRGRRRSVSPRLSGRRACDLASRRISRQAWTL